MKLVEILARELKEWPEGVYAMFQSAGGSIEANTSHSEFYFDGCDWWDRNSHATWTGVAIKSLTHADDYRTAIITRADWEAERARI